MSVLKQAPAGVLYHLVSGDHGIAVKVWAWFSNFFLLGSDSLLLFGEVTGRSTSPLLFIPAIWSLSTELIFYALAPLVLRRSWRTIAITFGVLLALRTGITNYMFFVATPGDIWTVWNYFFFLSALHLFLMGALAYGLYEKIQGMPFYERYRKPLGIAAACICLPLIPLYNYLNWFALQDYGYYVLQALLVPFLFGLTRDSVLDRRIGDYSYPFYLVHGFPLYFLVPKLKQVVPGLVPEALVHDVIMVIALAAGIAISAVLIYLDGLATPKLHRWMEKTLLKKEARPRAPAQEPIPAIAEAPLSPPARPRRVREKAGR